MPYDTDRLLGYISTVTGPTYVPTLSQAINVMDQEEITGGPNADNTGGDPADEAIQKAIDALDNAPNYFNYPYGGVVFIPAGTYTLTSTGLKVRAGVQVIGEGAGTVLKRTGNDGAIFEIVPSDQHVNYVRIANMTLMDDEESSGVHAITMADEGVALFYSEFDSLIVSVSGKGIYFPAQAFNGHGNIFRRIYAHDMGGEVIRVENMNDCLISFCHYEGGVRNDNLVELRAPVRVASTVNVNLTGGTSLTIDGVALANSNRVLLKNQSTASQNGIYTVSGIGSSYTLARSTDANTGAPGGNVFHGIFTFALEGTSNSHKLFALTSPNPIDLGVDDLTFAEEDIDAEAAFVLLGSDGRIEGTVCEGYWAKPGFRLGGADGTATGYRCQFVNNYTELSANATGYDFLFEGIQAGYLEGITAGVHHKAKFTNVIAFIPYLNLDDGFDADSANLYEFVETGGFRNTLQVESLSSTAETITVQPEIFYSQWVKPSVGVRQARLRGGDAPLSLGQVGGDVIIAGGAGSQALSGVYGATFGGAVTVQAGTGGAASTTGTEAASAGGVLTLIGGAGGNGTGSAAGGDGADVFVRSGPAGEDNGAGTGVGGIASLECAPGGSVQIKYDSTTRLTADSAGTTVSGDFSVTGIATAAKRITSGVLALSAGGSTTVSTDAAAGNLFAVTLGGNPWLIANPTNAVSGQRIAYRLTQDATGTRTVTWGGAFQFGGGGPPALARTAGQTDYVEFIYNADASKWDCLNAGSVAVTQTVDATNFTITHDQAPVVTVNAFATDVNASWTSNSNPSIQAGVTPGQRLTVYVHLQITSDSVDPASLTLTIRGSNSASGTIPLGDKVVLSATASASDVATVDRYFVAQYVWSGTRWLREAAIGNNNTVTGLYARAVGDSNTVSGENAVAVGNSNTVTAEEAIAVGYSNTVSGNFAAAVGSSNSVTANYSLAAGDGNTVSDVGCLAVGQQNTVNSNLSVVIGLNAKSRLGGSFVHACGKRNVIGDCQRAEIVMRGTTVGAATTTLQAGSALNVLYSIPAAGTYVFDLSLAACDETYDNYAAWTAKIAIQRNNGGTVSFLGSSTPTAIGTPTGSLAAVAWALGADNTNKRFTIDVTGVGTANGYSATTTIHYAAAVRCLENVLGTP